MPAQGVEVCTRNVLLLASIFLTVHSGAAALLSVNVTRVLGHIEDLAERSNDAQLPAVTRVLYTEADVTARLFLRERFEEAGLVVREDAIGNIFALLPGDSSGAEGAGYVGTGSHFDAIPLSGKYDGTLGVFGGLEALRAIRDSGEPRARGIELVAFTSEEPTRFGKSCIGSRALVNNMGPDDLRLLVDSDGVNFEDSRRAAGYSAEIESVVLDDDHYASFVELHIEQGRVLELDDMDIGVVTAIAGPVSAAAVFEGEGGHAGGMLMKDRHDAVLAGAEFALAVERIVLNTGSIDAVGTTGMFDVSPGAENSIGRRVRVSVDTRDIDASRLDATVAAVREEAHKIAERRGVRVSFDIRSKDRPKACATDVLETAETVAEELGFSHMRIVSRAYHDSLLMAQRFPTGMIFGE